MATFWNWGVRVPAAACGIVCIGTGLAGVADWSLALAAAMPFALVAELAGWAHAHAESRRARHREAPPAELRYVTAGAPPSAEAGERAA